MLWGDEDPKVTKIHGEIQPADESIVEVEKAA
jgi:hypothetical protein